MGQITIDDRLFMLRPRSSEGNSHNAPIEGIHTVMLFGDTHSLILLFCYSSLILFKQLK